jgi:hypothetical protein
VQLLEVNGLLYAENVKNLNSAFVSNSMHPVNHGLALTKGSPMADGARMPLTIVQISRTFHTKLSA